MRGVTKAVNGPATVSRALGRLSANGRLSGQLGGLADAGCNPTETGQQARSPKGGAMTEPGTERDVP